MTSDLKGKVVVISGAGGVLGEAFTAVFGRAGCKVAGLDVSEAGLEGFSRSAASVDAESMAVPCDLRDWTASAAAIDSIAAKFGTIDILINNATTRTSPAFKPIEQCEFDELSRLLEVGPMAALGTMRAAFPYLKRHGGKVINIGSAVGLSPQKGLGPYGMSKAAMHLLTQSVALEWAEHKINVNGILPQVKTAQTEWIRLNDPDLFKTFVPPLGYAGDGETDIGAAALFLASAASNYITGQNISVDGGFTLL